MSTPTKEDPDLSSASLTPKGTTNRPLIAQGSRRRAAKNLLRDYYVKPANASGSGSGETRLDAHQQFQQLYNNSSLKDLLAKDQELRSETGELESERQGLVYTRYHDLLDASDTIKAMKSRAESLDQSLESLRSNFERISQLCTSLSASSAPSTPVSGPSTANAPTFDPLVHLPPMLELPNALRDAPTRTESQQLWGRWEPVLRQWEEAGVPGVKEVTQESHQALSQRARSNSVHSTAT